MYTYVNYCIPCFFFRGFGAVLLVRITFLILDDLRVLALAKAAPAETGAHQFLSSNCFLCWGGSPACSALSSSLQLT